MIKILIILDLINIHYCKWIWKKQLGRYIGEMAARRKKKTDIALRFLFIHYIYTSINVL